MLDGETVGTFFPYLKYAHGLFSAIIIILFIYQGLLGLRIRMRRRAGGRPEVPFVRTHRKIGPFLVILAVSAFAGGAGSVFLQWDDYFMYPIHFLNGAALISLAVLTFAISRKIRGKVTAWRTVHYFTGLTLLSLFILQAYLGIRILFAL